MKIRVADFIAQFLLDNNINTVFKVVGGGAMHLNDGLGHNKNLRCIHNHHEQACSITAEGYYRISNKIPAVCVTTGPGGTNAITGLLGAYLDSIPMLIISGQVKYEIAVDSTGLDLRQLRDQEGDMALNGRPGPCWINVPLNVQGAIIDTDNLIEFNPEVIDMELGKSVTEDIIEQVITKIKEAKRPIIYADVL